MEETFVGSVKALITSTLTDVTGVMIAALAIAGAFYAGRMVLRALRGVK